MKLGFSINNSYEVMALVSKYIFFRRARFGMRDFEERELGVFWTLSNIL